LANARFLELAVRLLLRRGWRDLGRAATAKLFPYRAYQAWITRNEPTAAELEAQRRVGVPGGPRISIVVPTHETPPAFLAAMLDSVRAQTYTDWELCIADGNSRDPRVRELLERCGREDPRIRTVFLAANQGIAGNSNAALALASGRYVALLDHDDTLAPFALFEIAKAVRAEPAADFLYSDEDKINEGGAGRHDHHFKPGWSPDTLRSQNYITHLAVFGRRLLEEVGGFRPGFDGSQDYDLILRATERARKIVHIPKVLYHWRSHPQSVAGDETVKAYAYDAGRRALADHLARAGVAGRVEFGPRLGTYHVSYALPRRPLVSVIVPSWDGAPAPGRCLDALKHSAYPHCELIVAAKGREAASADARRNAGDARVGPTSLNAAVARARGEVVLFLDHRLAPVNRDWLERMVEHVLRAEVGAVGAKVCHASGSIRHAGMIVGLGGGVGHAHRHFPAEATGYGCRLITTQNVSAVSGDCLLTRRETFVAAGGFDVRYACVYWDVDYCLRLRQQGLLTVWTPRAELRRCSEGVRAWTRARVGGGRTDADLRRFQARWSDLLRDGDPYYNANLTTDWEDFALRT
jgi:GT2 family glycosyltransferase